jgi:hypothetical protein
MKLCRLDAQHAALEAQVAAAENRLAITQKQIDIRKKVRSFLTGPARAQNSPQVLHQAHELDATISQVTTLDELIALQG